MTSSDPLQPIESVEFQCQVNGVKQSFCATCSHLSALRRVKGTVRP